MKCTMDADINQCPHYEVATQECKMNGKCSFQSSEVEKYKHKYERKERWYERYYKKK